MKQEKDPTINQSPTAESRVDTRKSAQRKKQSKKAAGKPLADAPTASENASKKNGRKETPEDSLEEVTEARSALRAVAESGSNATTRTVEPAADLKPKEDATISNAALNAEPAQAPKRRTRKSSRAKAATASKVANKEITGEDKVQPAAKEETTRVRRPKAAHSNSSPENTVSSEASSTNGDRTSQKLTFASRNASPQPSYSLNSQPRFQPVNHQSDRIAIFIDGSNLFYAASHLNIEVDYRRLLTTLVRGRRLLRAYFYTGVDPQNEKQRGFLLWLNRHGHRVVSKELAHLPDGSRKANMHVEMAVDMMRIAEYCPTLTLLGGDGNLAYALQVLSQKGTFIEVVSLQSMTSDSLIDLADNYVDLADLRDDIKR